MALRARKVFGTFKKRVAGLVFLCPCVGPILTRANARIDIEKMALHFTLQDHSIDFQCHPLNLHPLRYSKLQAHL